MGSTILPCIRVVNRWQKSSDGAAVVNDVAGIARDRYGDP